MALSDLTLDAVRKAIEEFDRIGRSAFLEKYGFSSARSYILVQGGQSYDSKAIAGAAHGYLPGHLPLLPSAFSGGEAKVRRTLGQLGFEVEVVKGGTLPTPGDVLTNEEISRRFMVGSMGGMRRSKTRNHLVLISDPFKGLYQDRWEGDALHYTGMGTEGDQDRSHAQNRTLNESHSNGVQIHLFEAFEPRQYTYLGETDLIAEPYQEEQPDSAGKLRKVWMFPIRVRKGGLVPALTVEQAQSIEQSHAQFAKRLSTKQLKMLADRPRNPPLKRASRTTVFIRDAIIAEYAKRLANGRCDLCNSLAPFLKRNREPYLECHHITWLAQGGDDTIENTVALCPNCHRKMHVVRHESDIGKLRLRVAERQD